MDQANYDAGGWGRKRNRVEPRVMGTYVGSDPLCSAPAHAWFTFTSATPTVCPTMPVSLPAEGSYLFDGVSVGHGSRFDADGTCSLSVQAPDFGGGAGYAQTLTFDVVNVAALDDQTAR
jgi:hypothetical protein